MKPGSAYYAGGVRIVVDGIPIRIARPISKANLAWLKAHEAERQKPWFVDSREKALRRTQEANEAIQIYAETLEISVRQAKARIERQRLHMLANPVRDISLEYDL